MILCFHKKRRKFENSITLKNGPRGHNKCVHVSFILQFSVSTVIDALQCLQEGQPPIQPGECTCQHKVSAALPCLKLFTD
eukprot:709591-Pelagomonas_calceolata.AAC.2